ncbi:LuxR C-terminal-related transcriptional regulator [Amycolatopsis sp.]|uniref:LuxR C-terminal-related transcriptional regulator n=1 Tax=Amycolatopsis sp. TaxID=37632 RepID=UPI002BA6EC4C|nr:LuxR C-terminal-related transcriptional regulator [Amycolatopsis sp.]HVV11482.1 LuxR C-terminal-related transcriptional regulator [Amycolatopsis sp.]
MPRLKIAVPDPPPDLVSRPRLLSILDRPAAVTLVCAPAGAGKTLLLADWARAHGVDSVAWVSLDPDDNDDRRFFSAVLAALGTRVPEGNPLRELAVPAEPSARPGFLARLAEALDELPRPLWLVLDDLHELTGPGPIEGLRNLLRHQPAALRLILATRREPQLSLARAKLAGRLVELRAADLVFSGPEAKRLLAAMDVELGEAELGELVARTEGWAAGLRLAAISRHATGSQDFAGHQQAMGEFLIGEVLSRLPGPTQEFIRAISVCAEVDPGLAGTLSGRADAGAMLAELERNGSLAVPVRGPGPWYRLHAPLRTHVLADLRASDPALLAGLHSLAADWFGAAGKPLRALEHAAAAGDEEQVVLLLRESAVEAILAGKHQVLQRALSAVSRERIAGDSLLGLVSAALHLRAGEPRVAEVELSLVRSAWPAAPSPELETVRQLVGARLAQVTGKLEELLDAGAGLAARPARGTSLEAPVLLQRGAASFVGGKLAQAVTQVSAGLAAARAAGQDYVTLQCLSLLGGLFAAQGDYTGMTRMAAETVAENAERGWDSGVEAAGAHGLLAFGALLRAELGRCAEYAAQSQRLLDAMPAGTGGPGRLFTGLLLGAAEFDGGDRVVGARRMTAARTAFGETRLPAAQVAMTAFLEHRAAVALGWTGMAAEALQWCGSWVPGCGELLLMRARAQLAAGHHGAAAGSLRPLVAGLVPVVLPWSGIWIALAETEIALRAGDRGNAHRALSKALRLAAPQQVRYPFVFAPPAIAGCLTTGLGRFGAGDEFAREILAVRAKVNLTAEPVVLTDRERDVLRLLPTQRSFEEIAEDLTVSPNTVKTHARALYGKLGVTKRREAVDAARAQGLLGDAR